MNIENKSFNDNEFDFWSLERDRRKNRMIYSKFDEIRLLLSLLKSALYRHIYKYDLYKCGEDSSLCRQLAIETPSQS